MSAKVKVMDGNYQITIPVKEAFENPAFRKFLELERVEEILSRSEASDEEISVLAKDVDGKNWEENREWFLRGISH